MIPFVAHTTASGVATEFEWSTAIKNDRVVIAGDIDRDARAKVRVALHDAADVAGYVHKGENECDEAVSARLETAISGALQRSYERHHAAHRHRGDGEPVKDSRVHVRVFVHVRDDAFEALLCLLERSESRLRASSDVTRVIRAHTVFLANRLEAMQRDTRDAVTSELRHRR